MAAAVPRGARVRPLRATSWSHRRCTSAVLAVTAVVWGRSGGARCFSRLAWPDTRLWVEHLRDASATVSRHRNGRAITAFDAYSSPRRGTREVQLGGERFFAFVAPRLGAEHFTVWRRTEDVRAAGDSWFAVGHAGSFGEAVPFRLLPANSRPQLTAAVWKWDKLDERDPNRYWEDTQGQWMYWESFWAPSEEAGVALPSPAFEDDAGRMLAPLLGTADNAAAAASASSTAVTREGADSGSDYTVPSTATATAMKDKAYAIVYEYNVWGSDVSRSGTGSDLWSPEARLAITALEAAVDHLGVRRMLDCACGDATWIVPYFVARHPEVYYTGIDIVADVIEQNRKRHPGVDFRAMDLAETPLPQGADLIFSKETMNHMGIEDAQMTLQRFAASGARYLLTNVHEGSDNELGRNKACFTTYIKYDYNLPPFSMKRVASIIEYQGLQTSYQLFELQSS